MPKQAEPANKSKRVWTTSFNSNAQTYGARKGTVLVYPLSLLILPSDLIKIFGEGGNSLDSIHIIGPYGILTYGKEEDALRVVSSHKDVYIDSGLVKTKLIYPHWQQGKAAIDIVPMRSLPKPEEEEDRTSKGRFFTVRATNNEWRNEKRSRRVTKKPTSTYIPPPSYEPAVPLSEPNYMEDLLEVELIEEEPIKPVVVSKRHESKKRDEIQSSKHSWLSNNERKSVAEISMIPKLHGGLLTFHTGSVLDMVQRSNFSAVPVTLPLPPPNTPPALVYMCLRTVADIIKTTPQKLEMLPQDIITKLLNLMSFVTQTLNDNALYSCLTSKLYELTLSPYRLEDPNYGLTNKGLQEIGFCKELRTLCLSVPGILSSTLCHIFTSCKSLQHISLNGLEHFSFEVAVAISELKFLESLSLSRSNQIEGLEKITSCSSLKSLTIENCSIARASIESSVLTTLQLKSNSPFPKQIVCPSLEFLHLVINDQTQALTNAHLVEILKVSTKLKSLILLGGKAITDVNIFAHCPQLEQLQLADTGIKGEIVPKLHEYCPNLVSLDILPSLGFFTFGANLGGDPVTLCSQVNLQQLRQLRAVFGNPKGDPDVEKDMGASLVELVSTSNKKDVEITVEPFDFNCPLVEDCTIKTAAGQITPGWLLSRLCTGMPHLKKLSVALTGAKVLTISHFFDISAKGVTKLISMPVLEEILLETASCTDELIACFLSIAPNLRQMTCTSSNLSGGFPFAMSMNSPDTTSSRENDEPLARASAGSVLLDSSLIACAESLEVISLRLSQVSKVTPTYLSKVFSVCKAIKIISLESFRSGMPALQGPKVEQLFLRDSNLTSPFEIFCPLIQELDVTGSLISDLKVLDDIAKGCPALRKLNVDFSGAGSVLDDMRLPAISFPSLEILRIANAPPFDERDIINLSLGCFKLKKLILNGTSSRHGFGGYTGGFSFTAAPTTTFGFGQQTSFFGQPTFASFGQPTSTPQPSAVDLSPINFQFLSEVDLSGCSFSDQCIEQIINGSSNAITKLNLRRCSKLLSPRISSARLEELCLEQASVTFPKIDCINLQHLDLSNSSITDDALNALSQSCPQLRTLFANRCSALTQIVVQMDHLELLELRGCDQIREVRIECKSLKELYIDSARMLSDSSIPSILALNPRLEFLDLSRSDGLMSPKFENGASLKDLYISNCSNLMSLTVASTCPCLSMVDATKNGRLDEVKVHNSSINTLLLDDCPLLRTTDLNCPNMHTVSLKECKNIQKTKIQDCTKLQEIDLTKSNIDSDFIQNLVATNNDIRKLALRSCHNLVRAPFDTMSDLITLQIEDCSRLFELRVKCPKLKTLIVERCVKVESLIVSCPILEEFSFRDCQRLNKFTIESSKLKMLVFPLHSSLRYPVINCPSLKWLDLGDAPISDETFRGIMTSNPNICYIHSTEMPFVSDIKENSLPSQLKTFHCQSLPKLSSVHFGNCTSLSHINLSGCPKLVKFLLNNTISLPHVTILNLASCNLGDRDILQLISAVPSVTNLNISGTNTEGAVLLELAKFLPKLAILTLRECLSLRSIVVDHPSMVYLDLSECHNLEDLQAQCPALCSLNLSYTKINISTLGKLSTFCSELKYLWLRNCNLYQTHVAKMNFPNLEILEMDYCSITDIAMAAIIENAPVLTAFNASFVKNLTVLHLHGDRLLNVNIHDNYHMEELTISGNSLININAQANYSLSSAKVQGHITSNLCLSDCFNLSTLIIECPLLLNLHLSSVKVATRKIIPVLLELRKLIFLDITGCKHIASSKVRQALGQRVERITLKEDKNRDNHRSVSSSSSESSDDEDSV